MSKKHIQKKCKAVVKCIVCIEKHVALLCNKRNIHTSIILDPKTEQNLTNTINSEVYLKTLQVKLINDNQEHPCGLFFDDGSQKSYISKRMASLLDYEPVAKQTIVHGLFGGTRSNPENHTVYKVRVASATTDYRCNFEALDKDIICEQLPVIDRSRPWVKELKKLNILLTGTDQGDIDVLVGADIAGKFLTGKRKLNEYWNFSSLSSSSLS